jgi:hypothetical protein
MRNELISLYSLFQLNLLIQITVSSIIPAAYEVTIRTDTKKAITAITFDQQGAKFATGSYSYSVNMYEFQRMDSGMNPFRQVYPCERFVPKINHVSIIRFLN